MDISDILILIILVLLYGFPLGKIISKHIEYMDLSKWTIFGLFCAIIFLFSSAFVFLGVTVFQNSIKTAWNAIQVNPRSYESLLMGFSFFVLPIWVMCTLITKDFIINTLAWMEARG